MTDPVIIDKIICLLNKMFIFAMKYVAMENLMISTNSPAGEKAMRFATFLVALLFHAGLKLL